MKEKINAVSPENLVLKKGSHAYLLKDELVNTFEPKTRFTMEEVQEQMEREAEFAAEVRAKVESLGGVFNGIRTIEVNIPDPEWMGSAFPHKLTFVLADYTGRAKMSEFHPISMKP